MKKFTCSLKALHGMSSDCVFEFLLSLSIILQFEDLWQEPVDGPLVCKTKGDRAFVVCGLTCLTNLRLTKSVSRHTFIELSGNILDNVGTRFWQHEIKVSWIVILMMYPLMSLLIFKFFSLIDLDGHGLTLLYISELLSSYPLTLVRPLSSIDEGLLVERWIRLCLFS